MKDASVYALAAERELDKAKTYELDSKSRADCFVSAQVLAQLATAAAIRDAHGSMWAGQS